MRGVLTREDRDEESERLQGVAFARALSAPFVRAHFLCAFRTEFSLYILQREAEYEQEAHGTDSSTCACVGGE